MARKRSGGSGKRAGKRNGGSAVSISGAAEAADQLDAIAGHLSDWSGAGRELGGDVLDDARRLAPRRTGRLRASATLTVTPLGVRVAFTAPYAAAVNRRRRFAEQAAAGAGERAARTYSDHLAEQIQKET